MIHRLSCAKYIPLNQPFKSIHMRSEELKIKRHTPLYNRSANNVQLQSSIYARSHNKTTVLIWLKTARIALEICWFWIVHQRCVFAVLFIFHIYHMPSGPLEYEIIFFSLEISMYGTWGSSVTCYSIGRSPKVVLNNRIYVYS